jgi:hypothetical protein
MLRMRPHQLVFNKVQYNGDLFDQSALKRKKNLINKVMVPAFVVLEKH